MSDTPRTPPELYHYTCAHQAPLLEREGYVMPMPQLVLGGHLLAWFTDLNPPVPREVVGLTSHLVGCDRTEVAYLVDPTGVLAWSAWRNIWLRHQLTNLTTKEWREARLAALRLESAHNAMPRHWFVAEHGVRIIERARVAAAPVSSADAPP